MDDMVLFSFIGRMRLLEAMKNTVGEGHYLEAEIGFLDNDEGIPVSDAGMVQLMAMMGIDVAAALATPTKSKDAMETATPESPFRELGSSGSC